ncbi:MAG: glycosyltransferase [Acidobacteriota bacterium]|nr:glycosyltransferase [Acidobacteriota bacterium]
MTTPRLSIIVPNFNYGRYLGECLEAILAQSVQPLEVIVVDDGSTDDSVAVAERHVARAPHVRLIRHEANRGLFDAFATGLAEARGDYVYLHSSDDRVLPGFIERSLDLLARHPQAGLCCSDPASFEDGSSVIRRNALGWSDRPRFFSPVELAEVMAGGAVAGHTTIVRLDAFREAGGYRPELRWHCDWFAWLAVGFRHGVCYIPEALAAIRSHGASYGAAARTDRVQQREVLAAILRLLQSPEYRDLLPYFARGSVLSHFGDEVVRAVLGDPALWSVETLMLIQEPLHVWSRGIGQAIEGRTADARRADEDGVGLQAADAAIARGQWRRAYGLLARLARQHPGAETVEPFAGVAMLIGRDEAARRALDRALAQAPDDAALKGLQAGLDGRQTSAGRAEDGPAGFLAALDEVEVELARGARVTAAERLAAAIAAIAGGAGLARTAAAVWFRGAGAATRLADCVRGLAGTAARDAADRISLDHVESVVVFGAGEYGALARDLAHRCGWAVRYIVDNDRRRWDTLVDGIPVAGPDRLAAHDFDLIIVASRAHGPQIAEQLDALGMTHGFDYVSFLDPITVGPVELRLDVPGLDR